MTDKPIKKISHNIYEIPKEGGMKVSGKVFASEKLIENIKKDRTLEQIKNVACLPGIINHSIALADAHQGYGFSIGGVAAFDLEKGVISPGGVGYDINCSVRLLKTNLTKEDINHNKEKIIEGLFKKIPSGIGRGSKFIIKKGEMDKILQGGAKYIVEKGYGKKEDYIHTEEEGCMKEADASNVSQRARKRGMGQLGTLGAGNHFLEIQCVEEIFDENIAKIFEIKKGDITIMIHCGSRGLGHQIASDYIQLMEKEYGYPKQDRELVNAPIKSELGKNYFSAMSAAANFAFANKQLITHWIREEFENIFPEKKIKIDVIYDICHNIAKMEEHLIKGKNKIVCIHRKGATRSFGPNRKEVPEKYRKIGQPVIIPGSMGTASYLLIGTKKAEELTFASTVHGAGRISSRNMAMRNISGQEIKNNLSKKGIEVKTGSLNALAAEAPEVYKDVDEVIKTIDELGINRKVAKLKPVLVIKG